MLNYPRRKPIGWTRWLPSLRLWILAGVVAVGAVVGGFAIGYALTPVPEPNVSATGATTNVYYDDGKTPIGQLKIENRQPVSADDISPKLKEATVAAEDKTFYENRGISVKGLGRAFWGVITNDYAGGGSSITQQYVKNYYLTNDHTLTRKVKEMFISLKIDQVKSKDEILTDYLNTVYLGRRAYGVEVASQTYFHKSAKDLNYAQSSMLAAMIQRPGASDPADNRKPYEGRYLYVLQSLVDNKNVKLDSAKKMGFPKVYTPKKEKGHGGQTGYMLRSVVSEMKKQGLSEEEVYRGGYNITTTFNKKDMKAARAAVKSMPKPKKGMHIGLVSMDPKTGGVRAMYGGKDYLKQQFNNSTQQTYQAGSTFKPFTLVAGIEKGYRLTSTWPGYDITINPKHVKGAKKERPWHVHNFDGESYGSVSLLKATESSINTAYGDLNAKVGPKKTVKAATRAGLSDAPAYGVNNSVTNVLGTATPTTLQMSNAYATFAAKGVYRPAHFVKTAKNVQGKVVYKPDTKGDRKFDKNVMAETTYALRQVVNGGSGTYAQNLGKPAAGKTGTSSSNQSASFAGYTPNRATVVSVTRTKRVKSKTTGKKISVFRPIGSWGGESEVTGSTYPVRAWTHFMQDSLRNKDTKYFPDRPNYSDLPQLKSESDDDDSTSDSSKSSSSGRQDSDSEQGSDQGGSNDSENSRRNRDSDDDDGDTGDNNRSKNDGNSGGGSGGDEDEGSGGDEDGGDSGGGSNEDSGNNGDNGNNGDSGGGDSGGGGSDDGGNELGGR